MAAKEVRKLRKLNYSLVKIEERNKLMQSIPVACITGPVHGSPAIPNLL